MSLRLRPALASTAALAVGLLLAAGGGPAARAAEPTPQEARAAAPPATTTPVLVSVDDMTPLAPVPGDTLQISGSLTNTTDADIRTVSVRLRISPRPLVNRAEIARIATGRTERTGNTLWNTQVALTALLSAHSSIGFDLSVPVDTLGLSATTAAVEIIGVEALGDLVVGDGRGAERVGLTTTFLPWFPVPGSVVPTHVVWLWPLTDPPARDSTGTLLGDGTGVSMSSGGRLRNLVDLAARSPVPLNFLVDPALVETAVTMSDGYQVRQPDGTSAPGTSRAPAATWLADLKALVARPGSETRVLPYALPDVVALHRAGQDLDVTRSVTDAGDRVGAVLDLPASTTMAWPAGGVTDAGTLDVLRAAGARDVLLSAAALPADQRPGVTLDGVAPLSEDGRFVAVLADPRLTQTLELPTETPGEAFLARQRLLAEVAATTLEQPTVARTVVAAPPPTWAPDAATTMAWLTALQSSPWMRAASLDGLLALPAASDDVPARTQADYRRRDQRAELPQQYVQRVGARRADLASFRAVTSDAADPRANAVEDALSRTESLLWRANLPAGRALLDAVSGQLDRLVSQVRVVSRGTTTFPGETGVVPIVVANDLDQPVRVGVTLSGTPAVRFSAKAFPTFTIDPRTKSSIEIPATVLGSGDVAVQVQLTTADGQPYGQPTTLTVRSTAYARAAGWVVGGLLALTVALLAVNFVRRRRGPQQPQPQPQPQGPDVGAPGGGADPDLATPGGSATAAPGRTPT